MNELTDILCEATRRIEPGFFRVPIDGGPAVYRERTYCYELYHQMRTLWPTECLYRLNGELDKRGHPRLTGMKLDGSIPDFLVHQPGCMAGNHAIIEVKSERASSFGIAKDLAKLSRFRHKAGYERTIYLVFGENTEPVLGRVHAAAANLTLPCLIEVWMHSAPSNPAEQVMLLRRDDGDNPA